MEMREAVILPSRAGRQRVGICRHQSGAYTLRLERRYESVHEGVLIAEGWQALPTDASLFHSVEIAELEARTRYRWIAARPGS